MAAAQGGDFYQDIFPYINDRDQPMQAIDYLQGKGEPIFATQDNLDYNF